MSELDEIKVLLDTFEDGAEDMDLPTRVSLLIKSYESWAAIALKRFRQIRAVEALANEADGLHYASGPPSVPVAALRDALKVE